jgi:RNA recognition motif-containing protein
MNGYSDWPWRGDRFHKGLFMASIYVGNLSYDATEEDIRQAFAQYGDVATVNVIMDRETGRPRGFAFVEMPNGSEAKEAIEKLNETEIAGRAVIVNEARPKQDRPRGGGGGRRGGGGGGRGRW